MAPTIPYQEPAALLASTQQELDSAPSVRLFNDSNYQKLTERWCAAMFGLGYSKFVAPCRVAVNEGRYREDVDIYLRAAEHDWAFQLAEVQEPGRRRGLEYKQFADRTARTIISAYDAEHGRRGRRGSRGGPGWLAGGVERKKAKCYASSHALHLLLYADFPARDLQYTDVVAALARFVDDFASLWVVTDSHLCSVFSSANLGEVKGWGPIDLPEGEARVTTPKRYTPNGQSAVRRNLSKGSAMERTEFQETYPNYCRRCQGWGTFKRLSPDVRIWDCEECIIKGCCPRCGENALNEMDTCSDCGWYRDDNNRGFPGSIVI